MGIYINNEEKKSTLNTQGNKLGTHYLADNPQYFEIQRNNNFMFYIEGLANSLNIVNNKYAESNPEDVLRLAVSSSFVPHFQQSPIVVKRGNNAMKFAGTPEFQSGSIKLDDFIGSGAKDVLMAWQGLAYNIETEKVGLASDYKRDAHLIEYTPDYQIVRTWKLKGCWISNLSEDEYNHESADKHTVTATIEYDKAFIDTSDIA